MKFDRKILKNITSENYEQKEIATKYLKQVITEGLENGTLKFAKSSHIDLNTNINRIANMIQNEINSFKSVPARFGEKIKYGTVEKLEKALETNPYFVIRDALTKFKSSKKIMVEFGKVPLVNKTTHKIVKGQYIQPSNEYYAGKSFYENVIKGSGLNQKFQEITKTGIELTTKDIDGKKVYRIKSKRPYNIVYDNFHRYGKNLTKTVIIDGEEHILTGYVTWYQGAKGNDAFIIQWESKGGQVDYGTEILDKKEFGDRLVSNNSHYSSKDYIPRKYRNKDFNEWYNSR